MCRVQPFANRVSWCLPREATSRTSTPVKSVVASCGTRSSHRVSTRPASAAFSCRQASQTVSPSGIGPSSPVRTGSGGVGDHGRMDTLEPGRAVLVWGNCQAAPLADLMRPALTAYGCEVLEVPPVFLVTAEELAQLQEALPTLGALVSQPVSDEYRVPGCGTRQLAERLPPGAPVVTVPVMFDSSAFPFQVNAHDGTGARVDAPLTDYHDLRALVAAERGLDVDQTLEWWPAPAADRVRANATASVAELARRDEATDVDGHDLLGPGAMFTLSHPTNLVLAAEAGRILRALGVDVPDPTPPEREYLGERRAPVEAAVVDALGWPDDAVRADWVVRHETVPLRTVLEAQLAFYAAHPDVPADSAVRHAARRERLGL